MIDNVFRKMWIFFKRVCLIIVRVLVSILCYAFVGFFLWLSVNGGCAMLGVNSLMGTLLVAMVLYFLQDIPPLMMICFVVGVSHLFHISILSAIGVYVLYWMMFNAILLLLGTSMMVSASLCLGIKYSMDYMCDKMKIFFQKFRKK